MKGCPWFQTAGSLSFTACQCAGYMLRIKAIAFCSQREVDMASFAFFDNSYALSVERSGQSGKTGARYVARKREPNAKTVDKRKGM